MMEWVPIAFVAFKLAVFGTGMFFAIRWHYEQGNKGKERRKKGALLRAGGKAAAIFVLSLLVLSLFAFGLSRMLGLELTF